MATELPGLSATVGGRSRGPALAPPVGVLPTGATLGAGDTQPSAAGLRPHYAAVWHTGPAAQTPRLCPGPPPRHSLDTQTALRRGAKARPGTRTALNRGGSAVFKVRMTTRFRPSQIRVVQSPIKKSVRFSEASAQGRTMLEFAPDHEGTDVYRMLAEVIIHDHKGK